MKWGDEGYVETCVQACKQENIRSLCAHSCSHTRLYTLYMNLRLSIHKRKNVLTIYAKTCKGTLHAPKHNVPNERGDLESENNLLANMRQSQFPRETQKNDFLTAVMA